MREEAGAGARQRELQSWVFFFFFVKLLGGGTDGERNSPGEDEFRSKKKVTAERDRQHVGTARASAAAPSPAIGGDGVREVGLAEVLMRNRGNIFRNMPERDVWLRGARSICSDLLCKNSVHHNVFCFPYEAIF